MKVRGRLCRLIPEAQGTTCDQRIERIEDTRWARILRVPFKEESGAVVNSWISRWATAPPTSPSVAVARCLPPWWLVLEQHSIAASVNSASSLCLGRRCVDAMPEAGLLL